MFFPKTRHHAQVPSCSLQKIHTMNRTNKHRCDDGNDDGNEGDDGDIGIDGIDGIDGLDGLDGTDGIDDDDDEDEDEEEEDDIDDGWQDGDDDDDDDDEVDEDDDIKLSHTQQFYTENALTQKHLTEELVWAKVYTNATFYAKNLHIDSLALMRSYTRKLYGFFWGTDNL